MLLQMASLHSFFMAEEYSSVYMHRHTHTYLLYPYICRWTFKVFSMLDKNFIKAEFEFRKVK